MGDTTRRSVLVTTTTVETRGDADYHERTALWVASRHRDAASRVKGPAAVSTRVVNEETQELLGFSTFGSLAAEGS